MEAFAHWKDAQLRLQKATQTFLDASISLRDAISQHFAVPSRHSSSEDLMFKIQSQIALSNSIENQLAISRAAINSTRNLSPAFVPINVLPPELFSRIFAFVVASKSRDIFCDGPDPLLAISAVCTRWRQIAIGNRSFWSHIDLITPSLSAGESSDTTEITQIWLERSQGTPLHLSVNFRCSVDQRHTSQILCVLQPHLACLASLVFPSVDEETLELFLTFCSRHGVPGSLKSLVIHACPRMRYAPRQSWPTAYLRGLVELQLSYLLHVMSPNFLELSTILSGSPTLQTLRLRHLTILPGQALTVDLPELRLLDITGLDYVSLPGLLNGISPGGHDLDFRFSLRRLTNSDFVDFIIPFCRRSKIVSLYLSDMYMPESPDDRVVLLLSCMAFMRVLIVESNFGDFHSANLVEVNSREKTPRCPKLNILCWKSDSRHSSISEASQAHIQQVLDVYSLSSIVLEGFDLASYHRGSQHSDDEALSERTDDEFVNSLSRKVQSVLTDRGLLDGENEQVDVNIRKMIDDSRVASIDV
ncbi:hypothetical protein FRC12_004902 [Ceratobasidium sp. 428]|nr:hypothetical protein FRC12_004902 [Ceratobasidium sp. 428]